MKGRCGDGRGTVRVESGFPPMFIAGRASWESRLVEGQVPGRVERGRNGMERRLEL